jgi:hypothetical protein
MILQDFAKNIAKQPYAGAELLVIGQFPIHRFRDG